jgi:hypothetical protein
LPSARAAADSIDTVVSRKFIQGETVMTFRCITIAGILTAFFINLSSFAAAETATYTYDNMQRLIRAQYDTGAVFEYVYDNMGNRLGRNVYTGAAPANSPPNQAASPFPADLSINIAGPLTISWTGSDPNPADRLSYFVYAGTSANALQPIWSGSATSFSPWSLLPNTTYFWRVTTRDNHNLETPGPVWSFTTGTAGVNPLPVNLDVFLAGTGSGSVTSTNPAGIACSGAVGDICARDFSLNTPVTLSAVVSNASRFEGWSVTDPLCQAVPNYTTPPFLPIYPTTCTVTLTGDTAVAATFNLIPPIRLLLNLGPGFDYPYEMDSFATASGMLQTYGTYGTYPMSLQSHDKLFIEDFVFNSGLQSVRWQGGYNGDYSSVIGRTRIQGKLTVTGGKLIVERVVVK